MGDERYTRGSVGFLTELQVEVDLSDSRLCQIETDALIPIKLSLKDSLCDPLLD